MKSKNVTLRQCLLAVFLITLSAGNPPIALATPLQSDLDSNAPSDETPPSLKIFITELAYTGNLGGTSGADALCNADASKPAGDSLYSALIGTATRYIGYDWPLAGNQLYVRADGTTPIGITDEYGVLPSNLTNSISDAEYFNYRVWTGLDDSLVNIAGVNCIDFTSDGSWWVFGLFSWPGRQYTPPAGQTWYQNCDSFSHLYCVEQSASQPTPEPTPAPKPTCPKPAPQPTPKPAPKPAPSPTPTCTGINCGVIGS